MTVGLKLLEIDEIEYPNGKIKALQGSVLDLGHISGTGFWTDGLKKDNLEVVPVPSDFNCSFSTDKRYCKINDEWDYVECEETGYGNCKEDPYGDRLMMATADELVTKTQHLEGSDSGWDMPDKRGIYEYLNAVPRDRKFALYYY